MKEEKKICPICGKQFCDNRRKYCSDKCTQESNRINSKKRKQEIRKKLKMNPKVRKKGNKLNALELTAKAAKEAGMTYGQYVALHHV